MATSHLNFPQLYACDMDKVDNFFPTVKPDFTKNEAIELF